MPIVATNAGGIPEALGTTISTQSPGKARVIYNQNAAIQFGNPILSILVEEKWLLKWDWWAVKDLQKNYKYKNVSTLLPCTFVIRKVKLDE